MVAQLCYRDYTSISTIYSEAGQFSVAHHEPAQNSDWAVYSNDNLKAIVWGQPPPTLDASVIQQAMRVPLKLRGLDGSWALAAISGQQILITTDRMASRPVFYSEQSPIRVASELKVDFSKAVRALGHQSTVTLEEGIPRTINWQKEVYGCG